jgi:acyl-coenzyme A synthetase/AMP-(fatty) acid ligase
MFPFEVKHPEDSIAVIDDNGSYFTYGDMDNFTKSIHKLIQPRCLLFCLSQNTIGSLLGYVSFLSSSVVPVMLHSTIDGSFLETLVKNYRPQYVWLPNERINEFTNYPIILSKYNYSLVQLEEKNHFDLHPELAILLTTSGSTSSSKFVRISYENLKANTYAISTYLSIDKYERPITILPMWYSYGLSVINCHLSKGAMLLLTSRSCVEKEFWDFFRSYQATSLSGVPYTIQILKSIKFSQLSLPSLKTITQAGGKLNDELTEYITGYADKSKVSLFLMYGQTEATARMSYLPPEYSLKKAGSIGFPIPEGSFSLVDAEGNEIIEAGVIGELIYKGKNVSLGYASNGNDLKKGDENNGTLFTGDLARRDQDNFYYIVGRKKRFIKLFGNRLCLDEMENLLTKLFSDCACTGTDDNLMVYATDVTTLTEIKKYISNTIGIHPKAFSIKHCSAIPKNAVGKIQYFKLEGL